MSGLRRIVNNTLISLFGQLVTWTSTLGLTIAYGRFLGDVKFGELYTALAFVSLVGFPIEFGFNQQITRDIAVDPKKAQTYLWNTLLIKVVLWIFAYGAMLLLARALGYSQEVYLLVAICGIGLLSGSIVNTFAALHYAFERTVFPSVGLMLEKGLSAGVGFILLKNGANVQTMALVLLGGSAIDAGWVAWWFFHLVGRKIRFEWTTMLKLIRTSLPFVIYGVLGVIYYRIDTILLSLMTNSAVVGWYGAGYRLFDTLLFIPNLILNAVMYPVFAKLSETSRTTLRTAVEKCMNLLLLCSLPMGAFMIVAAPAIVGFLYHSSDFTNSIPVIQGLAPGLVFLYINTLFSSIIVSTRGEKKIPIMAAAALVFNLGMNLFLIPRYQQVGAAVVTSLTELLLLCISCTFVPKYLLPRKSLKVGLKALLATLCMASVIFLLQAFSVFVLLPVALVVFIGVAVLLRTIPRNDMQALYQAIKRRKSKASREALEETLANVADENLYQHVTNPRLSVVTKPHVSTITTHKMPAYSQYDEIAKMLPDASPQANQAKDGRYRDGEITKTLPGIPKANDMLPNASDEGDESARVLPHSSGKSLQYVDDDATELRPVVNRKKG